MMIKDFLNSLDDSELTFSLIGDKIDEKTLKSIDSYAKIISRKRRELEISDNELISSSMILGFLLKSYIDREDLEKIYKTSK